MPKDADVPKAVDETEYHLPEKDFVADLKVELLVAT